MRSRPILLILAHLAATMPAIGAEYSPSPEPAQVTDRPQPMPTLDEVRGILLTNLTKTTSEELDRAAVQGILDRLEGKIELVEAPTPRPFDQAAPLITKTDVLDESYGYIRVGRIEDGLAGEFDANLKALPVEDALEGLILDLRFAKGVAYLEAARFVDRFLKKEKTLLRIGAETVRSSEKTNAITAPVAVLINAKTSGAAEALAAMMRRSNVGLLIGADTAGGVNQFREFPLSTGQRLRVATGPLLFGDGEGETLIDDAVQPDIEIGTPIVDELAYLEDAYRDLPGYEDLIAAERQPNPFRPLSEAELVRRHNKDHGGGSGAADMPKAETDNEIEEPREIRDPALSRALDVLKALSVVRQITPF